ncbi:hypothetical protein [Microbulbifer sp. JTAC008]|uniref:hypothetical protein n=1 Tax=unclassified Microbulbifer TaxID=2619833 RepID=UPI004039046E
MKQFKYKEIPLGSTLHLTKYLRIIRNSRSWNWGYYACIDHKVISPIYDKWLCFPQGRYNPDYPKLIEVGLYSDELIDAKYRIGCSFDGEVAQLAYTLAEDLLSKIESYSDFKKIVNDRDEGIFFRSIDTQIFLRSFLMHVENGMPMDGALAESEKYFGKEVMKRDFFKTYFEQNVNDY